MSQGTLELFTVVIYFILGCGFGYAMGTPRKAKGKSIMELSRDHWKKIAMDAIEEAKVNNDDLDDDDPRRGAEHALLSEWRPNWDADSYVRDGSPWPPSCWDERMPGWSRVEAAKRLNS